MKSPSPDDMIYAGLLMRLGLTTREEVLEITAKHRASDISFVEVVLREGILSPDQHRAIQETLAATAADPKFARRGSGDRAFAPSIDQMGLPTIVQGDDAATAPPTPPSPVRVPPPRVVAAPLAAPPVAANPDISSDDFPTTAQDPALPPPGLDAPTLVQPVSHATSGTASGSWSSTALGGSVTREDIDRAQKAITRHGDSLLGTQIGGCVLLDKLGRGGMGEVYLAKQLALNRYVAFKVLPASLAKNQRFVERFVKEAQTVARINFPNIVQVFDVGVENGLVYFTMELVRGRTVQDIIRDSGTVPVPLAINIIKQTCRALARVAREGIIHRDIKPGNIMVTDEGDVKVCDFGIAAEKIDEKAVKEIAGTAFYIAPECLSGVPVTSESDQYSLGMTFYHMLAGLPSGTTGSFGGLLATADLPRLSDVDSSVPEKISDIVARMMAPEPEHRWRRFAEVFKQLEDYELSAGLIKAPSEFLADRLVGMKDAELANLKRWIAILSFVGVGFAGLTMLSNMILTRLGMVRAMGILAGVGTILIFVAYSMILYVGLARKRKVKAIGNLRTWVQTHYWTALAGYFMVMIHSGNFLGVPTIKRVFAPLGTGDWNSVPTVAFLSSASLLLVIVSGLIGRYIFRELHKQVALERFGARKDLSEDENRELTRLVIGARIMGAWRILHYPMTLFMILMVILHVASTMFYGAKFFGG